MFTFELWLLWLGKLFAILTTSVDLYLILAYALFHLTYNIYLHPLSSYPGPIFWRATRLPHLHANLTGVLPHELLRLHQKYGPVVRVAPDELSYSASAALKDIYGHQQGRLELGKDKMEVNLKPINGAVNILGAERAEHARYRRLLSHGFSEKGMREMQPRIQAYVDLLIAGLREECGCGRSMQDMLVWFDWTKFDMIGDLAFGEPFGCLEKRETDPWVDAICKNVKAITFLQPFKRYGLEWAIPWLAPKELMEGRRRAVVIATEKIDKRIAAGERDDFWNNVIVKSENGSDGGMSRDELVSNATLLVLAGSETTATLLSGTVYLLLRNPRVLKMLVKEIRESFARGEEITLLSVNKLEYMFAVLNEAMRVYPPVPNQVNRRVPAGGSEVCGQFLPEGTSVQVQQFASAHLEANFREPEAFIPERWMGDPRFEHDDRNVAQPFSLGPRNCIGRNLAYAEMRLIPAKVLYTFDMTLDIGRSDGCMENQKAFGLWEKPPQMGAVEASG
ncbi:cytochrome P450 [Aulographum hederae CBS 113979]|uniref:Cytochrome P450 n=1 Tax=Aulographum hederae CBS 113979 TaxID=1176131 RepID=A0A6G1HGA7_9PEZI|nr:cytochrome P450 [Aulographum hederae CBS 113979]